MVKILTRDLVLELLEERRGENVSGESLAAELGVSRTAVWKAVKELEKDGYMISAVTKKGYCLAEENDIVSVQGIRKFLRGGACGAEIFVYPSLDSTNTAAKQMAIEGAAHGTVVIADTQTAGRGRFGRTFFSPPSCAVYMSFVLRPAALALDVPTLVTAYSAVAVCEAIEAVCGDISAKIKWVNDIFLDGRKICGISTEAVTDLESGNIEWLVVGIGVNFRMAAGGFPEEIKDSAGAIFPERFSEAGKPGDGCRATRNRLIAEIILRMTREGGDADFLQKYRNRLLFLGENITVHPIGAGLGATAPYDATAIDIDEAGRLLVRKSDGEMTALSSGEVSVRRA